MYSYLRGTYKGVAPDDTRHLQRTTIKGDYALGRIELADGEISHEMRLNV